jgi:hypothetical protein
MNYFFIHQEKKNGKKLRIIFGFFWFGIIKICNEKLAHDA